jgi:DNA-binding XRE family transcriptional regulator
MEYRRKYDLSQNQLAELIGASDGRAVWRWETEKNSPRGKMKARVIEVLANPPQSRPPENLPADDAIISRINVILARLPESARAKALSAIAEIDEGLGHPGERPESSDVAKRKDDKRTE